MKRITFGWIAVTISLHAFWTYANKKISIQQSGIGGCGEAEIQTFIPESGTFEKQRIQGMLELVSLTGNIVTDDDERHYHHAHAMFSHKDGSQHRTAGRHTMSVIVSYTAEIELRPVIGGEIKRKYDSETGTGFWSFQ